MVRDRKERLREMGGAAVRFAAVGIVATVIHYGIYLLLMRWGASYLWAYSIGFVVSLAFNLAATARYTFRTSLSTRKAVLFVACHLFNFTLHTALIYLYVNIAGIGPRIAPIFVYLIAVPVNFLLVRAVMRDKKR